MGTTGLTVFEDEDGDEIAVLETLAVGSPDEYGKELADFLAGGRVVNGYYAGTFNGANCMAAYVVAHFKSQTGTGGFYLHPPGTRNNHSYIYKIRPVGNSIRLIVTNHPDEDQIFFEGSPDEYDLWMIHEREQWREKKYLRELGIKG